MIQATEVRKGIVIQHGGELFLVTDQHHQKMQNRRPIVTLKIKSLDSGLVREEKFSSSETLEQVYLDKKEMEYLYADASMAYFMDTETYEQMPIARDVLGDTLQFIRENDRVEVVLHRETPISVNLPAAVVLKVTETEPGLKGATVTNVAKPATVETGLQIKVPTFVNIGDLVKIDTRSGEYLSRASE